MDLKQNIRHDIFTSVDAIDIRLTAQQFFTLYIQYINFISPFIFYYNKALNTTNNYG